MPAVAFKKTADAARADIISTAYASELCAGKVIVYKSYNPAATASASRRTRASTAFASSVLIRPEDECR